MHPNSFRPFIPQIQSLIYPLIAPTPSNFENECDPNSTSASVSQSARHLFVLLHVSGPRNTAGEEWARSLDALIISVQNTADKVFRSVIEDWTSSKERYDVAILNPMEEVVSDQAPTPLALPAWTGIYAGTERIDGLLHTLQTFLATTTAADVTLPVGSILNLVDRILSIVPPGNGRSPRSKPEIGRDEREGLWVGLPRLQTSVMGVCSLMISRMGHSSAAIACTILEQLLWTFESQYGNDDFRKTAYTLVSQIISTFGPSLPRAYASSLSPCIRMCCEDLLPTVEFQLQGMKTSFPDTTKATNGVTSSTNADSYLKAGTNQVDLSVTSTGVLQAARELLPLVLTNLPNEFLPFPVRCQIDRTAIITNNKKVMLASVMNPVSKRRGQKQTSSILPLLARAHSKALEVETLLRPQMPLIQSRRTEGRDMESDEEGDIYMQDQPQVDESNDIFQNLGDTNGNPNVKENIVLGQSGVAIDATSGAVEEDSPRMEPTGVSEITATSLPEPKFNFSNTSTKRDREEESDLNTKEVARGNSIERAEEGLTSKRSRVALDENGIGFPQGPAPPSPEIVHTPRTGKKIPTSDSAAVSHGQSNTQQEDSDESEFEMPILNMDPDTDEEEEEEEENAVSRGSTGY